jgi:hypothetical protein
MLRCPPLATEPGIYRHNGNNSARLPISPKNHAMNDQILSFLFHLDEALLPFAKEGERFDMFHLGRSALVMHHGFPLSTKDIDIVGRQNPELDQKAIELFGEGSPMARSLGLYLDLVSPVLPPLPTR